MIAAIIDPTFESWQESARGYLAAGIPHDRILWLARGDQMTLPLAAEAPPAPSSSSSARFRVPKRFVELARIAACHDAADRWSLLYRVLWRLLRERRGLLDDDMDADVARLRELTQAVRHDMHRMLAFVRFRRIATGDSERFVAWYAPDFNVAALVGPHFAARYPRMRWSIFTPQASVHWSGDGLSADAGVPAALLPVEDTDEAAEALWRVYYAAAFNPARLNEEKLRRDMPLRFRNALPEAREIPRLVATAPLRVAEMRARTGGTTDRGLVPLSTDLGELRDAAACCQSCPLYERATQTVFGNGPSTARLMLVGEQPGDSEDRSGRPFTGPAGDLLNEALSHAGLPRDQIYLTNAVKHFGWEPRGKRRIHRTPRLSEIQACRPWVEREIAAVKPEIVVLLGGVAARSLLGPQARVTALRGTVLSTPWAPAVIPTYHPSAVLRAADEDARQQMFELLVADLRLAGSHLQPAPDPPAS